MISKHERQASDEGDNGGGGGGVERGGGNRPERVLPLNVLI